MGEASNSVDHFGYHATRLISHQGCAVLSLAYHLSQELQNPSLFLAWLGLGFTLLCIATLFRAQRKSSKLFKDLKSNFLISKP